MIIKILITGYCILITAILANILASFLNILTWYDLYISIIKTNFTISLKSLSIVNTLWLFFAYPLLLSIGYIIGEYIIRFISL